MLQLDSLFQQLECASNSIACLVYMYGNKVILSLFRAWIEGVIVVIH